MQPIEKQSSGYTFFLEGIKHRDIQDEEKAHSCFQQALSHWEQEGGAHPALVECRYLMKLLGKEDLYSRTKALITRSEEEIIAKELKKSPFDKALWYRLRGLADSADYQFRLAKIYKRLGRNSDAIKPVLAALHMLNANVSSDFKTVAKRVAAYKLSYALYESMGYPQDAQWVMNDAVAYGNEFQLPCVIEWFKREQVRLKINLQTAEFASDDEKDSALAGKNCTALKLWREGVASNDTKPLVEALTLCLKSRENVPLTRKITHTLCDSTNAPLYHAYSIGIHLILKHKGAIFPLRFPSNWVMLCIGLSPSGLRISRWQKEASPISLLQPFAHDRLDKFDAIINKTVATTKRITTSYQEKKQWWHDRAVLDQELKKFLQDFEEQLSSAHKQLFESDAPLILILDDSVQRVPWESLPMLRARQVSRMPSVASVSAHLQVRSDRTLPKSGYYVINPDNTLSDKQKLIESSLSKEQGWDGIFKEAPSADALIKALGEYDIYLYCGHGSSEFYLSKSRIQCCIDKIKSVALLMGCSSALKSRQGLYDAMGVVDTYIEKMCPAVVGTLWDCTDLDLDRLLLQFLAGWRYSNESMLAALYKSRDACLLPYLNGAATIVYGLPY